MSCDTVGTVEDAGTSTLQVTTSATEFPVVIPTQAVESVNVSETEEPEEETLEIVFWTVEEISSEAEGEAANFFRDNIRRFERNNPDIELNVLTKKISGKGGVIDFLRTAKEVAPSVLPDVAIMQATDLHQATVEGLIQPLEGRLDRSIVQDLLPAARKMGTIDERLLGVPIGLEMEHTVYNRLNFEAPPLSWQDVLTSNTRYLFPAQGVNGVVNDLTLAQYFSVGGRFFDDEGAATLDERALREVLEFYQQAVENEVVDATLLEASSSEELWPIYVERQAGITQVTVERYLTDRTLLSNTAVMTLPIRAIDDPPVLITHGLVFVLVADSSDVQRQATALSLIEWFMSSDNNQDWNELKRSIPTRDTSFQAIAGDDPYWQFLAEQLNVAQPEPGFDGYDKLGRIMQQAVVQVISGESTAEEATTIAIDALTQ